MGNKLPLRLLTKLYLRYIKAGRTIPENLRLFESQALVNFHDYVKDRIKDAETSEIFSRTFFLTSYTTVITFMSNGEPLTYIITGDIPAMWLRDSAQQVLPYLEALRFEEDEKLDEMLRGLIKMQSILVQEDPYANAFYIPSFAEKGIPSTVVRVWERKWELDSLMHFLFLTLRYIEITKNKDVIDEDWKKAFEVILETLEREMRPFGREETEGRYRFLRKDGRPHPAMRVMGMGYPCRGGLVRCTHRPSDDEVVLPYNVPDHIALISVLEELIPQLKGRINTKKAEEILQTLKDNIKKAVVAHENHGKIFAYEIDGYGSLYLMDDPNLPSLLSLPLFGYQKDHIYENTRNFVLSDDNPFYIRGKVLEGLGSPHTGYRKVWPMAEVSRALTSNDQEEIDEALERIKIMSRVNHHYLPESVNVDDPTDYTRPWFGWACSYFAYMVIKKIEEGFDL